MRLVNYFSIGSLDETCQWLELEGEYKLYERTMYNLKLSVHSNSDTCDVYPIKGYECNPILEGRRSPEINSAGFYSEREVYCKEAILEYLKKFFPQYISVDVYILTEEICIRRCLYSRGEGRTNEFIRDKETNELKGLSGRYVKFQFDKQSVLSTYDVVYRKIIDTKKIDTIVRVDEESLSGEISSESFFVYEHYYYDENLQKDIVFYVGKGSGEAKGSNSRIYSFNRNKFWQEIVDSLDKRNIKWKYRVVKFFNSNADALNFELKLQEYYWEKGQCLGCADLRRRHKYNQTSC